VLISTFDLIGEKCWEAELSNDKMGGRGVNSTFLYFVDIWKT